MSNKTSILLQNGRVIDPSQGVDRVTNLLIRDGKIAAYDVSPNGQDRIVDATGKIVSPGLIDMHVHLREPGARKMKPSPPAHGSPGRRVYLDRLHAKYRAAGRYASQRRIHTASSGRADKCNVYVIACVSKNREGKELAELGQLVKAGEGRFHRRRGSCLQPRIDAAGFRICAMFDRPILNHAEVRN